MDNATLQPRGLAFLPMANRLQKHLASLELTKPGHRS